MLQFKFLTQAGAGWGPLGVDIRDLEVVEINGGPAVIATTGPGGGLSSLAFDGAGLDVLDTVYFSTVISQSVTGETAFLTQGGQDYIVVSSSAQGQAVAYRLNGNGDLSGTTSPGLELYAGDSGPVIASSGAGYVYTMAAPGVVQGFAYSGSGYSTVALVSDTDTIALADPVALETVTVGGAEFLVALSEGDIGVTAMRIEASGALDVTASVGNSTGVGILGNPTEMQIAQVGGKTYVLTASAADNGQGGALTVMELRADGSLHVTDHILDSLHTRFGTATALDVIDVDGWTYVVAGGGDSGLSLFALAPGGRLLHLDTIVDTVSAGLETISALALLVEDAQLNVFAASQAAQGLAYLSVDLGQQGLVLEAGSGDATGQGNNDLLVGGMGDNVLRGQGGDDILIDGYGRDTLWGGSGADTFVLGRDGQRDEIRDFEPGTDRIDLSSVSFLYDSSRLSVNATSRGAELVFPGGEVTVIHSADGGPLSRTQILAAIDWEVDRPALNLINQVMGDEQNNTLTGTNDVDIITGLGANDIIYGLDGDDRIDGGWGSDTVIGGDGADVLTGDLGRDLVEGGAGNDTITDRPQGGVLGQDTIRGGDGDDSISSGGGWDLIYGDAGDDWAYAGWGNDTMIGGTGNDTLIGVGGFDTINGQDGDDELWGGNGNDWLDGGAGNDTIYGGSNADYILGGAGADWLEGQHGFDTIYGGDGDDVINGGLFNDRLYGESGNDTLSGGNGADRLWGGFGADLLLGGNQNDTLDGGFNNDTLAGEGGDDVLAGGGGNDRLEGGVGNDLLTGGSGADTFVFASSDGNDTITDFTSGEDVLELHIAEQSYDQIDVVAAPRGLWVVWDDGAVLLEGLSPGDIDASDVIFV